MDAERLLRMVRVEVGPEVEDAMRKSTYDQLVEKGLEEGKREGRAELLLRQLERRFGSLPADVMSRVRSASIGELEVWAERILDARSLADVFAEGP